MRPQSLENHLTAGLAVAFLAVAMMASAAQAADRRVLIEEFTDAN